MAAPAGAAHPLADGSQLAGAQQASHPAPPTTSSTTTTTPAAAPTTSSTTTTTPAAAPPAPASNTAPTPAAAPPAPTSSTTPAPIHALPAKGADHSTGPVDCFVECRICLEGTHPDDMVAPCSCTGTVKYAHLRCLKRWAVERQSLSCELCAQPYNDSVLHKIEPVILEAQRTATDAALAAAISRMRGAHEEADGSLRMTWSRFWCQAVLLMGLLVGVLYLALFVDVQRGGSPWTVLLWKVFTILLPLYLVGFWMRKTLIDSGFCGVISARLRSMRRPRPPAAAPHALSRLPV